ncbi:hypothetical protein L2E82_33453 [Cichorium intybus]|uniref:Uncharacterized protein n=1 Tax=Cichorium intybus TaxID=13427 RepID=A0ACB9BK63_CICIN|nr:hypothetical protein L2E82_33453 [Cichorium intybus]
MYVSAVRRSVEVVMVREQQRWWQTGSGRAILTRGGGCCGEGKTWNICQKYEMEHAYHFVPHLSSTSETKSPTTGYVFKEGKTKSLTAAPTLRKTILCLLVEEKSCGGAVVTFIGREDGVSTTQRSAQIRRREQGRRK